jgi:hypothetical protein
VTFAPGETAHTVRVFVRGDTLAENDETFLVSFGKPPNANLGGFLGLGYGVIADDDGGAILRAGAVAVADGDRATTTVDIPVTLSTPSSVPVSVAWTAAPGSAKSPGDFTAAAGTVTFAPGETEKSVTVTVNGDEIDEPDEYFVLILHDAQNAKIGGWLGLGFGIIRDDDM